jgi:cytochrome c-type biogenesis protein CcmH/NrfF
MPRIKMTPTVRVALWALPIYLLVLLTLIAIKFIRVFSSPSDQSSSPPAQSATK